MLPGHRRVGHGRGPDRAAAARDDAPDRVPGLRRSSAGSRTSSSRRSVEPAFRMNLCSAASSPRSPPAWPCSSSAASARRRCSRGAAALGFGLTPDHLAHRRVRGRPRAPHRPARRDHARAAPLGGGGRRRPARAPDDERARQARRPPDRRHRRAVRRRASRTTGSRSSWSRPSGCSCSRWTGACCDGRGSSSRRWAPRSASRPCCTSSCRSGPGRSARRSCTAIPRPCRGSSTSCSRASSQGDLDRRRPDVRKRRRRSATSPPASSGRSRCSRCRRVRRHGDPPPALRAVLGARGAHHLPLRGPVRRTPASTATTSGRCSSPGRGWSPRRPRSSSWPSGRRMTPRAGGATDRRRATSTRAARSRSPSGIVLLVPTAIGASRPLEPAGPVAVDRGPRVARRGASRPSTRTPSCVSWWSYSTPLWYGTADRGPPPRHHDHRRPDAPRRGAGRGRGRDRGQPRHAGPCTSSGSRTRRCRTSAPASGSSPSGYPVTCSA